MKIVDNFDTCGTYSYTNATEDQLCCKDISENTLGVVVVEEKNNNLIVRMESESLVL